MIEADLCSRVNCKLSEVGDQPSATNDQGADFLAQYEQGEADSQNFEIAFGGTAPASTDLRSNIQTGPTLVLSEGAKASESVRLAQFTGEPDATLIDQQSIISDSVASEPKPAHIQTNAEGAADVAPALAADTAAVSTETVTSKLETAMITAPVPAVRATQIVFSASQRAASSQVAIESNALTKVQLVDADTLPPEPVQLDVDLNAPGHEELLTVASEPDRGVLAEASTSPLQLVPGLGQSASITAAASQISAPQTIITAAPAAIVDIISQALTATDERKDRIIVQLDPPELGRVSIEFKFDAQGLQHITITGETPEALRRLRMMHYDLIQTLERDGLTGHGMTFRQHSTNQNSNGDSADNRATPDSWTDERATIHPITPPQKPSPLSIPGGGLNLKL